MDTAVILAGGKGTRLRPFTMSIPKPMLPLGDVPIIEVVWRQLELAGFRRVVMLVGHMAPIFRATYESKPDLGVDLEFIVESEPLGTAAPLRAIPGLQGDVLVMNGDVLSTIDYRALLRRHRDSQAEATIAAHQREVFIDYGVLEDDEEGFLTTYTEKPTLPYMVSMGIYVLSEAARAKIPEAGAFDMPQLLSQVRGDGGRVALYKTSCYWQDIGRFDDYQQASADFVDDPDRFFRQP